MAPVVKICFYTHAAHPACAQLKAHSSPLTTPFPPLNPSKHN